MNQPFVCVSCQRVTDLLPAWYYNFRVSMVTWGEPPLSCCDSSTVSSVTGMTSPVSIHVHEGPMGRTAAGQEGGAHTLTVFIGQSCHVIVSVNDHLLNNFHYI